MYRLKLLKLLNASFYKQSTQYLDLNVISTYAINKRSFFQNASLTSNQKHVLNESAKNLSENEKADEEFCVKLKNDPDTFGYNYLKSDTIDEDDIKEETFLQNPPPTKRLSTKKYADEIKALIRKKKIKEAIDFVEIKMIKEDCVKPESYIFNLILGACGRVGYTKKAFAVYNQMKKRGLEVTGGTYTALFNACSNSPWPADGLSRAEHLRNIMIEKRYEPNDTNYNAMIKAFGHCGDLRTAFSICDEMISRGFPLKDDSINFLLQACLSDKEAGYRHALLVWRKLISKNIPPTIFSYNLMLRCIRDCGLGDIETTKNVIEDIIQNKITHRNEEQKYIESANENALMSEENACDVSENNRIEVVNQESKLPTLEHNIIESSNENKQQAVESMIENRPNLMAINPHLGNILSLSEIIKPEDKLLLVGGSSGILQNMKDNKITPDIKTFTQLLDCIPSTLAAEKELIKAMKKLNVRPDIDFYNMLIKKRSMRFDYITAREVLLMMEKSRFKPNIISYGILALGCKTKDEAESLIEEMNAGNYRLNSEILGAMLHQACYHNNVSYILKIMDICLKDEIRPNKKFMECLAQFKKKGRAYLNDKDHKLSSSKSFLKAFQIFKMQYKQWLEKVDPLDEDKIHPWQQFRQTSNTDIQHIKDKEVHFKARHTSLFKKKAVVIENKPKRKRYFKKTAHKK